MLKQELKETQKQPLERPVLSLPFCEDRFALKAAGPDRSKTALAVLCCLTFFLLTGICLVRSTGLLRVRHTHKYPLNRGLGAGSTGGPLLSFLHG